MTKQEFIEKAKELAIEFSTMNMKDGSYEANFTQLLDVYEGSKVENLVSKDDLDFAIALQEENRLEAVKWLMEKLRPYSITPLKTAKGILDKYYFVEKLAK